MIVSADEWAKNTCLRFQEADDNDVTYILLQEGKKYCMSNFCVTILSFICDVAGVLHKLGTIPASTWSP